MFSKGFFQVKKACGECQGRGTLFAEACHACSGRGIIDKLKKLKIKIPPGADTGTVLRYRGEMVPAQMTAPRAEIFVSSSG